MTRVSRVEARYMMYCRSLQQRAIGHCVCPSSEARCEREATSVSCVCPVTLGCGPRLAIVFASSSTTYGTTALMDPGRPLQRTNRLG